MSDKINFDGVEEIQSEDLQKEAAATEATVDAPLSQEQLNEVNKEIQLEKKFGKKATEASLLGAARGLSFGLSDQFLTKTGIYTPEELREIKKRNEIASITGDVTATGAAILLSGGTGAVAKGAGAVGKGVATAARAGAAVEKVAEKAFISALAKEGKKSIAREIVKKSAPKVLGSAVEGAAYGVGQLVSEDALGNADLNAENIIASAGTGALLGGVTRGIFETPKALIPISKKATGTVAKKLGNAQDAAFDIYGVTPTKRANLKSSSPQFVEELPEWTVKKAKLGAFTDSEKLSNNLAKIRQEAGEKVGETMKKIDDVAAANPDILPSARDTYASIARKIDDEIIQKYADVPGFKTQIAPVKNIRNEFLELAKKPESLKASELHKLRMKVDELIKFDKAPGTFTLKEKALNDVRFALNDEIQKIAELATNSDTNNAFGNLLKDLLEANKDFSYASRLIPSIEKKVEKQAAKRSIFNLSDLVLGGAAYDVAAGLGGVAIGAKKLLESDFRRRVSILSAVERQNRKVDSTITNGIKSFFKESAPAARSAAKKGLITSNLSTRLDDKKKAKNRKQAFKNINDNILELTSNPDKLVNTIGKRTLHLSNIAPNITAAATQTAIRGVQFLASKLPKPTADASVNIFAKREFEPSDMQLAKFERYVEAVENPMSAVEDLKSGTLTREAAEAIKVVYPQIFAKLQENVINELQSSAEPVPYNKRLQLGVLLDIPTDVSLEPQNIAGLQSNLQPPEEQGPTPARADNVNFAEREETKQNRLAQR